jgi:ATP phosphoribosyltransferase regulatory subunit
MKTCSKITPEGTKDFLFEECLARQAAQQALTEVFTAYGYAPIATPHLEFHDVFRRDSARWLDEKLYCVTDSRGRLLVMRPDNTLPIARVVSTRLRAAALPLRLYYHQSVFRRARIYSGVADEYMQSGVELLGAGGLRADLEILSCAVEALQRCGAPRFRIEVGHAGIFKALAEGLSTTDELRGELIEAIKAKNVPRLQALLSPWNSQAAKALLALPRLFGGEEIFQKAAPLFRAAKAARALEELQTLYESCKALGLQDDINVDLGLVHGQQYYTGLVFRGYIEGSGKRVLSGGRYDALLAEFGRPAEAVGFALSLDPLAELLLESGKSLSQPRPETLVFGPAGLEAAALRRCRQLRAEGVACECAPFETEQQAKDYARARGIALVVVMD